MLPVFGNVLSLPFIVIGSISLLSKITSPKSQGLTQGIRRTFVGLACILGPTWSGTFYKQWNILVGSLIFLLTITLIMTIVSFQRLRIHKTSSTVTNSSSNNNQSTNTNQSNSSEQIT
jgi:hypothetical protein